jgi:serine phosphatase RsbU (regulator of sigma subunit)
MARPFLEYRDDQGALRRFELRPSETLIGRSTLADLVISQPEVSSRHAKITRDRDGFLLLDLKSKNGTQLNDEYTKQERLRSGDRIRLGDVELTFWEHEPSAEPSKAPLSPRAERSLDLSTVASAAGQARSELDKLSLLLELQCRGKQLSPDNVLQEIVGHALEISGAERGFLLVASESGFQYAVGLDARRRALPAENFRTSQTIVQKVARDREPVFMSRELSADVAAAKSISEMDLRAAACLPLLSSAGADSPRNVLGILYLDSTKPMHALTGLDKRILSTLAVEAASVLEKIEFLRELEDKHTLEEELALAQETQKALLPQTIPRLPGCRLVAHCRPTRYVGGDFYDFLKLDDDRLAGVLADVSGKGVAASLVSSSLQASMQILLRQGRSVEETLSSINRYLCERTEPGRFVTLFLFAIQSNGEGAFVSAGHNPAFIFRSSTSKVEALSSGGVMLGAFDWVAYREVPMRLDAGDVLLVYSDGITDARNRNGEMFGEERLRELLAGEGPSGVESVEKKLHEELDRFTQGVEPTDDITFILLQRD